MSQSAAKETLNPFEIARKQVKTACDRLTADPAVYEILKNPQRVLEVTFPVKTRRTARSKPSPATVRNTTMPSSLQRRRALPPQCESGRSQSFVDLDDHQMLRCGHSLRRRQRRHYFGSARLFRSRVGTHCTRLFRSHFPRSSARKSIFLHLT